MKKNNQICVQIPRKLIEEIQPIVDKYGLIMNPVDCYYGDLLTDENIENFDAYKYTHVFQQIEIKTQEHDDYEKREELI